MVDSVQVALDEIERLRSDIAQASEVMGKELSAAIGQGLQTISNHVLELMTDRILLRAVVAVLVTQTEPWIRDQILAIMADPAQTLFKGGWEGLGGREAPHAQLLQARGKDFRYVFDHMAAALNQL